MRLVQVQDNLLVDVGGNIFSMSTPYLYLPRVYVFFPPRLFIFYKIIFTFWQCIYKQPFKKYFQQFFWLLCFCLIDLLLLFIKKKQVNQRKCYTPYFWIVFETVYKNCHKSRSISRSINFCLTLPKCIFIWLLCFC